MVGVKAGRSMTKLSLGFGFACVLFAASVNANKPNILLVVVDDLGW